MRKNRVYETEASSQNESLTECWKQQTLLPLQLLAGSPTLVRNGQLAAVADHSSPEELPCVDRGQAVAFGTFHHQVAGVAGTFHRQVAGVAGTYPHAETAEADTFRCPAVLVAGGTWRRGVEIVVGTCQGCTGAGQHTCQDPCSDFAFPRETLVAFAAVASAIEDLAIAAVGHSSPHFQRNLRPAVATCHFGALVDWIVGKAGFRDAVHNPVRASWQFALQPRSGAEGPWSKLEVARYTGVALDMVRGGTT